MFLPDAAIRRWCGPKQRIGASRRIRAASALAQLGAKGLAGHEIDDRYAPLLGTVEQRDHSLLSEAYGNLNFLTPVAELSFESATSAEVQAYQRWKRRYERGWGQVFDPIAARIHTTDDQLELDLTVLPLSAGSDYEGFMSLVGEAELTAGARRIPDESIFHLGLALDTESDLFRQQSQQLSSFFPELSINPLAWVGSALSLDLAESPIWHTKDSLFGLSEMSQWPALLRIESTSSLKLGLFLIALKSTASSAAPGSLQWQTRQHKDHPYVVVTGQDDLSGISLYYATAPGALLLSLDEWMLVRALDREFQELSPAQLEGLPQAEQVLLNAQPQMLTQLQGLGRGSSWQENRREQSWSALPILNEWKRRFPQQDPLSVHRQFTGVDLHCPGGRGYRWNEAAHTMESVAYGYRAAPRQDPAAIPLLESYPRFQSALAFADGGLRLRAHLGNKAAAPPAPEPATGPVLARGVELIEPMVGQDFVYDVQSDEEGNFQSVTRTERVDSDDESEEGGATIYRLRASRNHPLS